MKKKIGKEIETELVNIEDEGDYGKEGKEVACVSSQLVTDLKGNINRACVMCEKLQEDSSHTEVMHETLVENLKDELCRVT